MQFAELIKGFAETYGVAGLAAEDGSAALEIDGVHFEIIHARPADAPVPGALLVDVVLVCAEIGPEPAEGAGEFASTMLRANFLFRGSGGGTLCQNPRTRAYSLVRPFVLSALDVELFAKKLAMLVDQVERWRALLENWNVAKEASDKSVGTFLLASGFIPV